MYLELLESHLHTLSHTFSRFVTLRKNRKYSKVLALDKLTYNKRYLGLISKAELTSRSFLCSKFLICLKRGFQAVSFKESFTGLLMLLKGTSLCSRNCTIIVLEKKKKQKNLITFLGEILLLKLGLLESN